MARNVPAPMSTTSAQTRSRPVTNRSAEACPLIAVGPRACKEPAGSRREHRSGSEHSGLQRPQNPDPEPEIPDERLDGTRMVVLTHERDGHEVGHAVQDGQAGQGGTGAAATAGASDLHPLGPGTLPGFGQSRQYFCLDGGQPEVRPPEPSRFPGDGRRRPAQQVHTENRGGAIRGRAAEAAPSDQPARGQSDDAGRRGIPGFAHRHDDRHWLASARRDRAYR